MMIEQLAKQILNDAQTMFASAGELSSDPGSKMKSLIEANLRKLNLVTREEFDAQQAVLERTREKLELLEKQLHSMEKAISENTESSE